MSNTIVGFYTDENGKRRMTRVPVPVAPAPDFTAGVPVAFPDIEKMFQSQFGNISDKVDEALADALVEDMNDLKLKSPILQTAFGRILFDSVLAAYAEMEGEDSESRSERREGDGESGA